MPVCGRDRCRVEHRSRTVAQGVVHALMRADMRQVFKGEGEPPFPAVAQPDVAEVRKERAEVAMQQAGCRAQAAVPPGCAPADYESRSIGCGLDMKHHLVGVDDRPATREDALQSVRRNRFGRRDIAVDGDEAAADVPKDRVVVTGIGVRRNDDVTRLQVTSLGRHREFAIRPAHARDSGPTEDSSAG